MILITRGGFAHPNKAGKQLTEDETIGPTFESIIMMWAMEKLDPLLPAKVKKDFAWKGILPLQICKRLCSEPCPE